jgi:hypothetical protein
VLLQVSSPADFDWSSGSLDRGFGAADVLDEEPSLRREGPEGLQGEPEAAVVPCVPQGLATPSLRAEARVARRGGIPWSGESCFPLRGLGTAVVTDVPMIPTCACRSAHRGHNRVRVRGCASVSTLLQPSPSYSPPHPSSSLPADLLTSLPVWAIVIASAANSFSFFMLLSFLPTYLVRRCLLLVVQ